MFVYDSVTWALNNAVDHIIFRNQFKLNLNILEHVILHIINCTCCVVKLMVNPTPCDLLIMS